jgi:hypothetical protein
VSISNEDGGKQAKNRKRNIIWFNPPYSRAVMTNVRKTFLQLMDKHFPPGNPLHQIFNRNKVKMSYRCTPNLARKISSHNAKILKSNQNPEVPKNNVTVGNVMNAQWRANVYKMVLFTRLQSADVMGKWTLILGCQNLHSTIDFGTISQVLKPETQRTQQVYQNTFGN